MVQGRVMGVLEPSRAIGVGFLVAVVECVAVAVTSVSAAKPLCCVRSRQGLRWECPIRLSSVVVSGGMIACDRDHIGPELRTRTRRGVQADNVFGAQRRAPVVSRDILHHAICRTRLQDVDIKKTWPGCVFAEPYVVVRSLPYERGQVRSCRIVPSTDGIASTLLSALFAEANCRAFLHNKVRSPYFRSSSPTTVFSWRCHLDRSESTVNVLGGQLVSDSAI